jgi:hypothetical protein
MVKIILLKLGKQITVSTLLESLPKFSRLRSSASGFLFLWQLVSLFGYFFLMLVLVLVLMNNGVKQLYDKAQGSTIIFLPSILQ